MKFDLLAACQFIYLLFLFIGRLSINQTCHSCEIFDFSSRYFVCLVHISLPFFISGDGFFLF